MISLDSASLVALKSYGWSLWVVWAKSTDHQHPLGRRVAVKVLSRHRRELKQYRHQFFQEACHSARLSHPNIISIFDYGLHDGEVFFIAMELS